MPRGKRPGTTIRRTVDVHRLRPAAEDHPGGVAGRELGGADVVGDDLAVDVGLADPAGDQLGVLRAEVDDENERVVSLASGQCPIPMPCCFCRYLPSVCSAGATITSAFWNSLTFS